MVTAGPPAISGISPAEGVRGDAITVTVSGSNFAQGAQVWLGGIGTKIQATSDQTLSANQIRCTLSIPAIADLGLWSVMVQNPGLATYGYKAQAFRVTAPKPASITSVSPTTVSWFSTDVTLNVYGSGLLSVAQVWVASGGTTIHGSGETTVSANNIRCTITFPALSPSGHYTVYVQNPGQAVMSKADAFYKQPRPVITIRAPVLHVITVRQSGDRRIARACPSRPTFLC